MEIDVELCSAIYPAIIKRLTTQQAAKRHEWKA